MITRRALIAVAALALGCPRRDPASLGKPPPPVVGPPVTLPDGGLRHSERLATIGWRSDGALRTCGSRGHPAGCQIIARPGQAATPAPEATPTDGSFAPDRSPPDAAPAGCKVIFADAPGDPAAPPARALLRTPTAALALDEWRPAPSDNGDYFAVETSFSPDGKWLAVVHTSVGLGIDDRAVDVLHAEVRPAPACR